VRPSKPGIVSLSVGFALAALLTGCGGGSTRSGSSMTSAQDQSSAAVDGQAAGRAATPASESEAIAAHLAAGEQALAASQWRTALDAFNAALAIDPYHPDARRGRTIAQAWLDQGSSLDATVNEIGLRRGAMFAEFDAALQHAREALAGRDFPDARGYALSAIAMLDRERQFLLTSEYQSRRDKAEALLEEIEDLRDLHVRYDR
jgi:hypothetical protein